MDVCVSDQTDQMMSVPCQRLQAPPQRVNFHLQPKVTGLIFPLVYNTNISAHN